MSRSLLARHVFPVVVALGAIACSGDDPATNGGSGGQASGGASPGGQTGSGGVSSGGTSAGTGGSIAAGGSETGGSSGGASGGTASTGGSSGQGGTTSEAGGTAAGTGGSAGAKGTGGTGPAAGGRTGAAGGPGRDGGAPGTGGRAAGGRAEGTGGTSAAGGTSGGGYSPCKASPCKILPFGDSITLGMGSSDNGGYRSPLFQLALDASQNITFTGSQMAGPSTVGGKTFPKNHEGYSGYTVESGFSTYGTPGIADKVPSPAFNTMPDIVLLHIGTNDLTSSNAKSTVSDRLDKLLTKIVGVAPDALIVVAKVIPLGYSSADWENYNAKIPGVVQAHVAKGEHMIVVDMSKLPSNQLNGVHPNNQGYLSMAAHWYEAIKDFLPN